MGESLTVATPWYPAPNHPFGGAFVRDKVEAVAPLFTDVNVYHVEDWPLPKEPLVGRIDRRKVDELLLKEGPAAPVTPERRGPATVTRIPAPIRAGRFYAEYARAHEHAVRTILRGRRLPAEVVHGHVGIYGGWVACQLAQPGARIFVTEHATFLNHILRQPDAREMYRDVVARCTAFFCVSEVLRKQLAEAFPEHAGKLYVVPNAVRVEEIPFRQEPVTEIRRWLYVGSFSERKGVRWLLEAFGVCALENRDLELTMVGGGPLHDELAQRVVQLGLQDRVRLLGPVPPEEVTGYLHSHDVLVHLSRYETFGMTVVEALASGIPVIVTRCGGPEETLSGIEHVAGEFVPVVDGVVEIVEAYRRLASRVDELDLVTARKSIEERYGFAAVREQLAQFYFGALPAPQEV
ncbi:Glycogen synthase [Carbonactinospora thermoautotrophica]|uniref:Glycogen synthase n=3 Tax=Carbonactinospora thermoautotrophica TaxID=1469144 RepID=A0A132MWX8_9ACTN|nr:glycosyltransferase [Carbonactinospora thermoautotrophica]KWX02371.1 Glycogen synthase [Carbonactinospora thermoautotrophica]